MYLTCTILCLYCIFCFSFLTDLKQQLGAKNDELDEARTKLTELSSIGDDQRRKVSVRLVSVALDLLVICSILFVRSHLFFGLAEIVFI